MPFVYGARQIVAESGLHRDLQLIFHIEPGVAAVIRDPASVTIENAKASYKWLVNNLLVDATTNEAGKAATIAYALTLIQRHTLPERPAFFFSAGQRGSGKLHW